MSRNKWLIAGAGILISVVLLWMAFRNLQPAQVWASIQSANMVLLAISAVWFFAAMIVITLRWQFLLNAVQRIPLRDLFSLVCIGYAGNNIYPFRSGELLRIVLLQRNYHVPVARGTTTVLVERVFDGVVLLSFMLVSLLFAPVSSPEVRTIATFSAPVFIIAVIVFFLLAVRPQLLHRLVNRISDFLPERLQQPLQAIASDVIDGLSGLRTPADLAGTIISSYGTWIIQGTVFWLVAYAFGLEMSFMTMLLAVGAVNLAGLIPASPGQFGVFETVTSVVLVAAGVPEVQAVAYALTVHMIIWLPVTLVGLFFLLQQGLGLAAITHAQRLEQKAAG